MRLLLFGWLTFGLQLSAYGQELTYCERFESMSNFLISNHLQPKVIDENTSVYVFDGVLQNLDPNRSLLAKNEYEELIPFRKQLHTTLLKNDCYFIEQLYNIYFSAVNRKLFYFKNLDSELLSGESDETVRFSKEPFDFDAEVNDLPKLWNKRIRYIAYDEVARLSKNKDSLLPFVEKLAAQKRNEIITREICRLENILTKQSEFNDEIAESILNLLGSYFDPHTNYFNATEAKSFMSGLATSNKSLGLIIELDEKEQLVVVGIMPGSSASKASNVKAGDIIRKISIPNTASEFDIACSNMEQLANIIFGEQYEEVSFELEKQDQRREKVTLAKSIIPSIENTLTVFVSESEPKIAYISISSFYSDFDGTGTGLTADFIKALDKCQRENVAGYIIDLSGNGGGSVDEAHRLSSIFINGKVAFARDRYQNTFKYDDAFPKYEPSFPIAIITDPLSASASEFFASAMQDYGKAIICGAPSSGKATMQFITPIDKRSTTDLCKITAQSFFRPSGETIQKRGIIPDVELPTLYSSVIPREENYETALDIEKIKSIKKGKLKSFKKLNYLKKRSLARQSNSAYFKNIADVNPKIAAIANGTNRLIPLKFEQIFEDVHSIDELYERVLALEKEKTNLKFTNLRADLEPIQGDPFVAEINNLAIEAVESNFRVAEVYEILKDYLEK